MNIEFSVKSFQDFMRDMLEEAKALDVAGGFTTDVPQRDTLHLYFQNQGEVEEAYTSAWIHRYYPRAFQIFRSFQSEDPLQSIEAGRGVAGVGGQMDPFLGTPWGRSKEGADVLGTIGLGETEEQTRVFLPIAMRQPMSHLAFLISWKEGALGAISPQIQNSPPAVMIQTHRKVKKRNGIRVFDFPFPAHLPDDAQPIIEKAELALRNGSPLVVISPQTADAHRYFVATEKTEKFDMIRLMKLGVVAQTFSADNLLTNKKIKSIPNLISHIPASWEKDTVYHFSPLAQNGMSVSHAIHA